MGFYQADFDHLVTFNSATSCDLLTQYESYVNTKIQEENDRVRSKTFAPSSLRCMRISWFRIRGVQPDPIALPDRTLDFTAEIGTACHEIIQRNMIEIFKDDWIDIQWYLDNVLKPEYKYTVEKSGYESKVEIEYPPIKFAVDGLIRINGEYCLLEIKTSEYSSFDKLTGPKPQHIDQVKCYCTLLGLNKALMLYQDRQYGSMKCFEQTITQLDKDDINNMFKHVLTYVESGLAPERLATGDPWCNPNHCPYYAKCREWG